MEIFNNWHNITKHASEDDMQMQVDAFLKQYPFYYFDEFFYKKEREKIVLREFQIREIGRISDHVLLLDKRRVINIECKLYNISEVIVQAESHLEWCDYSIICLPPDTKYVANKYKEEILKKGLGLFYWFKDLGIFEFILPRFNRNKNNDLRRRIIERIIRTQNT